MKSNEDEYSRALNTSLRILAKKAYSVREIEKKLIKFEYSEDCIPKVIEKLLEYNYIDDFEYAKAIIRSYANRGYGKTRIKQELYKRLIEKDLINELILEFETDSDVILGYYEKKLLGEITDYKLLNKTKAFLYRKGFSFDEIDSGFSRYKERLKDVD